ncbi:hypothetical protein N2152v2_001953 [Parachlorella kessleri]
MPGERFSVRLVSEDSGSTDRVTVEVGLEGFNILSSDGSRVLRKYPLHHISRWSMRGTSLILFTKSPVDVEDRTVTLQGDEHTIRSVLDTLTSSCMQMAELLQSGQGPEGAGKAAAQSLNMLLKKSKKPTLLTADQVEFWHHPEKAGWMWSQGEHIKTWRKRWFVLKQGFLFRFAGSDLNSGSKPRGIVDLSQVTDVGDGAAATGRPNSIKVSTAGSHICYLTDSETAQVEWISALEGAVSRIVKLVAGVEEEDGGGSSGYAGASGTTASASKTSVPKSWAEQLERSFAASGGSSGAGSGPGSSRRTSSNNERNMMVSVIGYGSGGGGGGDAGGSAAAAPSRPSGSRPQGGAYDDYGYIKVDYGSIAGAQSLPDRRDSSTSSGYGAGAAANGGGYSSYGQPSAGPQSGPAGYPTSAYQPPQSAYHAQPLPSEPAHAHAYGGGGYAQQVQQGFPQYQHQAQQQQQPMGPAGGYGGGGSTLLDSVTAPPAPQPSSGSPWQTHYTADGRAYYHNTATGITQWDPPY